VVLWNAAPVWRDIANRRRDRDSATLREYRPAPRVYRWDRLIAPLAAAIALALIATQLL
jgi:hypothetical protein